MTLIFLFVWRGKERVIVAANARIPRQLSSQSAKGKTPMIVNSIQPQSRGGLLGPLVSEV
jgi:hypothetical protein